VTDQWIAVPAGIAGAPVEDDMISPRDGDVSGKKCLESSRDESFRG
jgi:hypothetical protein